jgi:uncharacterized protein
MGLAEKLKGNIKIRKARRLFHAASVGCPGFTRNSNFGTTNGSDGNSVWTGVANMTESFDKSPTRMASPRVYLQDTGTPKGRGVFAQCDFAAGTVVEECPVILLTMPFEQLPPQVQKVVFNWGVLAKTDACTALALGYGSVYNHDNPANMRYVANPECSMLSFIAVRDIRAGEELTINYNAIGGDATWHDDNWFDHMNIRPIIGS